MPSFIKSYIVKADFEKVADFINDKPYLKRETICWDGYADDRALVETFFPERWKDELTRKKFAKNIRMLEFETADLTEEEKIKAMEDLYERELKKKVRTVLEKIKEHFSESIHQPVFRQIVREINLIFSDFEKMDDCDISEGNYLSIRNSEWNLSLSEIKKELKNFTKKTPV